MPLDGRAQDFNASATFPLRQTTCSKLHTHHLKLQFIFRFTIAHAIYFTFVYKNPQFEAEMSRQVKVVCVAMRKGIFFPLFLTCQEFSSSYYFLLCASGKAVSFAIYTVYQRGQDLGSFFSYFVFFFSASKRVKHFREY